MSRDNLLDFYREIVNSEKSFGIDYKNLSKQLIEKLEEIEEKRKYDLCFIYHLKKDKKQLQEKIDKAIEYLKKNACYDEQENYFDDSLPEICCKPMLEILKGVNNE